MDNSFSPIIKRCRKILWSLVLSGAWVYQKALGHVDNSASTGTLSVTDSRTGRSYNIPIRNNAVKALDFIQITTAGFGAEIADHYDNSLRVLDKGLWNTAVTETSITYIDGKAGHMQYRDKTIDELFHNNNYEEVVHLIIWGTLPTQEQKMNLRRKLASHMKPPKSVENAIKAFPPDGLTHPMLLAGIAAFAAYDKGSQAVHRSSEPAYLGNMEEVDDAIIRTLAALATTVAMVYCYRRGRPFTQANPDESYIGNILLMMGLTEEGSSSIPNRKIEHCLERLWVLNADHGMTNSTAVFLAAASTLQDPLSCTVAAVASAYGPLHGGAVEMAYKEFERVQCVENVPQLISDVKAKKYRLFGYGHRIYKVKDPRGQLVRQLIEEYKEDVYKNSFLRVAMEIDRVAEEDSYFISRNLKANADLYGCFLYTALGIETDTILSLSCLSRSPGVMAHWRESMAQSPAIWRPQHIFTGTIATDNNCKV